MPFEEIVYSVMIVSAADAFNESIRSVLPRAKFSPVIYENSISSAKRTLLERSFDIVIVNSPLPDDIGTRFAVDASTSRSTVVLLMVRAELYEVMYDKVAKHGVYVLQKPTSKPTVSKAVDWMLATRERLRKLEKKSASIEDKMLEIRTVNRAKWLLIEHMNMTEQDAHRTIEKRAMDECVSKLEIAEGIIKSYT